jgi:hypothetical protein
MYIIGFGCTAQVGKDTACEYLEKKYPGKVKRVGFADKLKLIVMELFDLSWEQCYGAKEIKEAIDERYGKSPRKLMQELGEKMREIYPEIWVDTVLYVTIPQYQREGYDCFVISDVRYPNETAGVHNANGVVVKVERDDSGVIAGKDHSSETALKDYKKFDFIIENNGSFEQFYSKLDRMMEDTGYGRTQGESRYGG